MHIIQNYTLKKNVVKNFLPLVMALLPGIKNLFGPLLMTCARNYRPSFRKNKPKTLVLYDWKRAYCACFRENWVYKFGHWTARATAFHFSGSSGTTCTSLKNSIADSPTHRYGESISHYKYLHEFEAKIETARKLVCENIGKFGSLLCSFNKIFFGVNCRY